MHEYRSPFTNIFHKWNEEEHDTDQQDRMREREKREKWRQIKKRINIKETQKYFREV